MIVRPLAASMIERVDDDSISNMKSMLRSESAAAPLRAAGRLPVQAIW